MPTRHPPAKLPPPLKPCHRWSERAIRIAVRDSPDTEGAGCLGSWCRTRTTPHRRGTGGACGTFGPGTVAATGCSGGPPAHRDVMKLSLGRDRTQRGPASRATPATSPDHGRLIPGRGGRLSVQVAASCASNASRALIAESLLSVNLAGMRRSAAVRSGLRGWWFSAMMTPSSHASRPHAEPCPGGAPRIG